MTGFGWSLVEAAAQLIEPKEREPVLGDLVEAGETAWRGLLDVLGLVIRRQALLWKSWRPWLAAFGVALPGGLLLMGVSTSVSCTYARLTGSKAFDGHSFTGHEGFLLLVCHFVLLIAWSWSGGFALATISRRTLWVSAGLCLAPCFCCLAMFREVPLPRLCLFLFLLPALLGVRHSLRTVRLETVGAFVLAAGVTTLMTYAWTSNALWAANWALLLPPWYLVAVGRRAAQKA
jgi:hypothetical protein